MRNRAYRMDDQYDDTFALRHDAIKLGLVRSYLIESSPPPDTPTDTILDEGPRGDWADHRRQASHKDSTVSLPSHLLTHCIPTGLGVSHRRWTSPFSETSDVDDDLLLQRVHEAEDC